jgi:hypothetical protein
MEILRIVFKTWAEIPFRPFRASFVFGKPTASLAPAWNAPAIGATLAVVLSPSPPPSSTPNILVF